MFVNLGGTESTTQGGSLVANAAGAAANAAGAAAADCSDVRNWRTAVINGKCVQICGSDLSTAIELDPESCRQGTILGMDAKTVLLAAAGGILLLVLVNS
jgi:hypothetical protein